MVFVVQRKGLWYVVESYRIPGHPHPYHRYLGPASGYPNGLKMVARKLRQQEEKAERKKHDTKELHYAEEEDQ